MRYAPASRNSVGTPRKSPDRTNMSKERTTPLVDASEYSEDALLEVLPPWWRFLLQGSVREDSAPRTSEEERRPRGDARPPRPPLDRRDSLTEAVLAAKRGGWSGLKRTDSLESAASSVASSDCNCDDCLLGLSDAALGRTPSANANKKVSALGGSAGTLFIRSSFNRFLCTLPARGEAGLWPQNANSRLFRGAGIKISRRRERISTLGMGTTGPCINQSGT